MKRPELKTWNVNRLHRSLVSKKFAIPKLQRNFVWDPSRAAKLLDSMYRDMPIGSLFLWQMDRKSANLIRQAANVLPPFNPDNRDIWFVIDGQQRLSVIYQAFQGEERLNDAGRSIDFSRLCFVAYPDSEQDDPPRIVYRKPSGREFVPLRDILAKDWRRRMPARTQDFLRRVQHCRGQILRYPMPVVMVRSATLDEIGEVFIRLNSQGMRITSSDRAVAMMGNLDVRAMAQELRSRAGHDVFHLPSIDPILMGFNLVVERPGEDSDPPKLESFARKWSKRIDEDPAEKDEFRKLWARYQRAFLDAGDYLHHRFPVYDESYLPSANMLATLAVFFYNTSGQPNRFQKTEIRKWFWATGVGQRYSGRGYHRNIASDSRFFEAIAKGAKKRFVFRERLDPVIDIRGAEYASRSARTRAFFCLLAAQNPLYLEGGAPIPLEKKVMSHSNRTNRHHIFPRIQLSQVGLQSRVYNSLVNICFLVSRENQSIGGHIPANYLEVLKRQNGRDFGRVMKSHLIPVGRNHGVWQRGVVRAFKQFREERLYLICRAFEKEAGIRLFARS